MCLSTVYKQDTDAPENILLEYVTEAHTEDEDLLFTDITGNTVRFSGQIKKIDLVKNIIVVA